jgi:hypothetical protein
MSRAMLRQRLLAGAIVLLLVGCDRQAGTGYAGEPLARIGGSIASSLAEVPQGLVPVVSWEGLSIDVVEPALTLEFPARFHIDIRQPPDPNVLYDFTWLGAPPGESRVGFAIIAAMPFEVVEEDLPPDGAAPFGVAERHMVIYAEDDVTAGSVGAGFVGGEVSAGFHVVDVTPAGEDDCDREFDCLRPSPDDLETHIEIRVDTFLELDFPDLGLASVPEDPM